MKLILLLPNQKSRYSDLYNVYDDLYKALLNLNIDVKIVGINDNNVNTFIYNDLEIINRFELINFIGLNEKNYIVTVDDFNILRELQKIKVSNNIIIWVHYFYGHKFLFKKYRNIDKNFNINIGKILLFKIISLIPISIRFLLSKFYYKTLSHNFVIAQSIWTSLLVERVYNVKVRGLLYIPVNSDIYNVDLDLKRNNILIFLGDYTDTSLKSLYSIIKIINNEYNNIKYDYFGDKNTGIVFENEFKIKLSYLGKLERPELSKVYNRHILTITPIYNGNFEMVPIQSLLCGTPVISYIQPFMEITNDNLMIANINNLNDVKDKINKWKYIDTNIREEIKARILKVMDNKIVANKLLEYIKEL